MLVQGLNVLRQKAVMPSLIFNGYNVGGPSMRGDVINVPLPPTVGTSAVTPANVTAQAGDNTPQKTTIPVNNWRKADPFYLTDREMNQLLDPNEHFIPMYVDASMTALAEYINAQIMSEYTGIYGFVGAAGTTPFGGSKATNAAEARATLLKQKAPGSDRRMVVDPDAGAVALTNEQLSDFDRTNQTAARIEGNLGRKMGFDWFEDQQVPTHTAGTLNGSTGGAGTALVNDAAVAIGDTTLDIDDTTLTGTVVVGDVFTVDGDTQTYVVTAGGTASSNALTGITFDPPAKVAWADNAAVTFKGDHVVNLAFHRDAFAFVSVPLQTDPMSSRKVETIQDPVTGITLRLEFVDQSKQSHWEFDVLFGQKLLRPELAVRVAG